MLKKEERSLNLRGQVRQLGSRTINYLTTQGKQNLIIIGVAIILFMIFFVLNPGMADKYNILSMVQSLAPYAILAIGVTFVIATGGIDLSIGTVLIASASVAGSIVMKSNGLLWLAIPLMIAIGTMFGAFNGFMVAKLKLPPFIATLGTMMFARGVSAIIAVVPNVFFPTNLESDWYRSIFSNFHNFPISLVWVFGLMFVCMFIMNKTKVGRYILAIGSNEEAARLSGIKTDNYKIIAYTIAGLFAGIAAIFWTAANPTITTATGNGMELDAIAGVYIGGTSAAGGIAFVSGSVVGSIILVIIRQGLNLVLTKFSIQINSTYMTYAITGIIVVVAVLMDVLKNKSMDKVRTEKVAKKYKETINARIEEIKVEIDYILSTKSLSKEEMTALVSEKKAEIATLKTDMKAAMPELIAEDKATALEMKNAKTAAK